MVQRPGSTASDTWSHDQLVSSNTATEQQIVIHMMIIEDNVKNLFLFVLYL